uniref:Uncharacterized protein n=1 Tax=Panagrolaimus sp. ES5 TaxID=591445 RepID=A0AC34GB38_9BILA
MMKVAIFKDVEEKESKIQWKKLEEIKIEETEKEGGKIGFRFEEAENGDENGYILWKISANLVEWIKLDTKNGRNGRNLILDSSIAFFRSNFPRKIIFTRQNLNNEEFLEESIRNGFYIFNDGYSIFPPLNFYPENIQALAEDDSELKEICDKVIQVLTIFNENEKFGRSLFQEQFEPYFWRHCSKEPLFWGLRNVTTKFFLHTISKPISLESFNHGNFLFSSTLNASALNILDEGIMKGIQFDDNNLGKLALYLSSKLPKLPEIQVCQSLYPKVPKPAPNFRKIPILIRPSLEEFLQYIDQPVVIKDFVQHFPLYQFFNFEYLNNVHGYRRVPIEFGSSYAGEDYSQKIVTIHEYLRDFLTS